MSAYNDMTAAMAGLIGDVRPNTILTYEPMDTFGFGEPAFGYVGDDNGAYNYYADTATVLYDADFVTSNSIAFSVNGVAITPVVFASDHDTTADALVAAINALTGVDCILDSSVATNRQLLIRTVGATITTLSTVTAGATQAGATYVYSTDQVFLGMVTFSQKETGEFTAAEDDAMGVLQVGSIWGIAAAALSALAPAYVGTANTMATSGYSTGGFYETNAAAAAALVLVNLKGKTKQNSVIVWA